jgi:hypothetical protein
MKLSELVSEVCERNQDELDTLEVLVCQLKKMRQHADLIEQQDEQEARAIGASLSDLLPPSKGGGKSVQPDSCFSLVKSKLEKSKSSQGDLVELLQEKKGWTRERAVSNLNTNMFQFKKYGIQREGRGDAAVWFAPTSNN